MPIPVRVINGKKTFTVLENNPEVMTPLAHTLGLSKDFYFEDIYSLDQDSLAHIPRPVNALLVILPVTPAWYKARIAEDSPKPDYAGKGPDEPVVWFRQTIGHACGSIGLLHCLINGSVKEHLAPNSIAATIREAAIPLGIYDRAQMLYENQDFEEAHQGVAEVGDTAAPSAEEGDRLGQHFVAFVKQGGRLWELEGSRKGPLDRGELGEEEDVLSPGAIARGIGRVMGLDRESGGGDLRFSCIALVGGDGKVGK